jgi:hypothetical protein
MKGQITILIDGTSVSIKVAQCGSASLNADPDTDPPYYFNADSDPDPAPHRIDANLRQLVYSDLIRLHFESATLHAFFVSGSDSSFSL